MKSLIVVLLTCLSFQNFGQRYAGMKIEIFGEGKSKEIFLMQNEKKTLMNELTKLINGVNDIARLAVDEDRLKEIKRTDDLIEIKFEIKINFTSSEFTDYPIEKILIPITGDLSSTEEDNAVVLLLGAGSYDTNPYINSSGEKTFENIKRILKINIPSK